MFKNFCGLLRKWYFDPKTVFPFPISSLRKLSDLFLDALIFMYLFPSHPLLCAVKVPTVHCYCSFSCNILFSFPFFLCFPHPPPHHVECCGCGSGILGTANFCLIHQIWIRPRQIKRTSKMSVQTFLVQNHYWYLILKNHTMRFVHWIYWWVQEVPTEMNKLARTWLMLLFRT